MKKTTLNNAPVDICKRTFDFAVRIVTLCNYLMERPGACRRLANQLLDAGTSIGANVEEAQAGQSRADFISKNSIALKEARETHYWLRLLVASRILPERRITGLLEETDEIMRIIGSIVVRAKRSTGQVRSDRTFSFLLFSFYFLESEPPYASAGSRREGSDSVLSCASELLKPSQSRL